MGARGLRLALGWTCLVLGVVGLFLPVLQGVLFLAIGLMVLAPEQEWARRLLDRLNRRFPAFAAAAKQAKAKAERWLRRKP